MALAVEQHTNSLHIKTDCLLHRHRTHPAQTPWSRRILPYDHSLEPHFSPSELKKESLFDYLIPPEAERQANPILVRITSLSSISTGEFKKLTDREINRADCD